ncbi:dienelactone hydrolase family protein [Elioraea sp.]|uniref:dienelactone hydrolase family protein n=1 Tax=Elioraea sp. TaxID=2185103 RepID=UPI0025BD60EB|nr:dienelactone hydrolase family protein [Elioraea sp.]
MRMFIAALVSMFGAAATGLPVPAAAVDLAALQRPWPAGETLAEGQDVTWPSTSPFTPQEALWGSAAPTAAVGTLFTARRPAGAPPPPAVILLHGSGGVLAPRERTYGKQFAAMGITALVVDAFAARRERGTSFTERLLNITESMLLADAYAGFRFLVAKGEADPRRVALVGFSYGAMATMYALNEAAARAFAPAGERFAAHAAFYGPCIARFEEPRTTGAPLLMLYGTADELIDPARCAATADGFRSGGSTVEVIAYDGAAHQWDGGRGPLRIGQLLNGCNIKLERDGSVRDLNSGLAMSGRVSRMIILGMCVENRPYLINADAAVRARSNADLGRFLATVFRPR